jgi:hypothetical protein
VINDHTNFIRIWNIDPEKLKAAQAKK